MSGDKKINTLLERFVLPERLERIDNVLQARTSSRTIVLENIRNPHNISAVLRSADAFGVSDVHLLGPLGKNEFDYSSGISLGSERWMQLHHHKSSNDAISALSDKGFSLVVFQPEEDTRFAEARKLPVTKLPFEEPLALIFGNEHNGVSASFVEQAKYHAFIPMFGFVESFNISVACAIALFCSTIAETVPTKRTAALSDNERDELRAKWLQQSVRGSEIILRDVDVEEDA